MNPSIPSISTYVLVVDDEPLIRDMLTSVLTRRGAPVRTAENGLRALEVIAEHGAPTAVISDVHMPRMSGLALYDRLAIDHPNVPVVLTSGQPNVLAAARSAGAFTLTKPYSLDDLAKTLAQAWMTAA